MNAFLRLCRTVLRVTDLQISP